MDQQKNKRIEDILNSTDGMAKASPAPFLLTRLYARMSDVQKNSVWDNMITFICKPAVAFTAIAIIICLNVLILSNKNNDIHYDSVVQESNGSSIDEFATQYNSIDYIENLAP